jgi:glycosyltransferase involved in cell wall biosynthesis
MSPTMSIVIACRNAAPTLGIQLYALSTQEPAGVEWEVLVADNGSTDTSAEIVHDFKAQIPNLRLIEASGRIGPAYARNEGARASTADWLGFLDADDMCAPDWVKATAGAANMGVHRDVFEEIGGFDEMLLTLEDCEFCWRLQLAATPLHFHPEMLVHARLRSTPLAIWSQAVAYGRGAAVLDLIYPPPAQPVAAQRLASLSASIRQPLAALWTLGLALRAPPPVATRRRGCACRGGSRTRLRRAVRRGASPLAASRRRGRSSGSSIRSR